MSEASYFNQQVAALISLLAATLITLMITVSAFVWRTCVRNFRELREKERKRIRNLSTAMTIGAMFYVGITTWMVKEKPEG
jgi:hypothetical protein